ncbi:peptidoglycan DD-metalloendopeptidase family protein [Streptomyces sp. NRRL F-5123]|uniref:peptidoglycan DD-metalloendopeptidase family protein n=1 Tax=Streptomyces sp. NRRL F-5123 TaxID=1463856 RepID=UPI0004E1EE41|nr:peptidoglycan DD-metalloendopeptidase family protein [Streptomyces sp. NRRL F-5123]
MNERHPSGHAPDYDAYAYDAYSTGAYQAVGTAFADDTATGTYGYIPQQAAGYGYDQPQAQDVGYGTGYGYGHDQSAQQQSYDPYAYPSGATYYDTGTFDAAQFTSYEQPQPQAQPGYPSQDWDSGGYPAYGYGYDASGDTGIYEQFPPQSQQLQQPQQQAQPHDPYTAPSGYDSYAPQPGPQQYAYDEPAPDPYGYAGPAAHEPEPQSAPGAAEPVADFGAAFDLVPDADAATVTSSLADERHDFAADGPDPDAPAARSRRRKPARRSALLTVAVPSVAVMGVAAVGAAAVTGVGVAQDSGKAKADASSGKAPTTQLDRQLAGVSADASDFADRASRTQERIDLKDRQAAAKKAAEAEAARKEALRPKFMLPVKQHGLSAYFGQAGVNWMSVHTGIDFPVMVGTPVMAVTDGTVRTQWNSSYGNMAIVTAPDGTETWYCHLSSTKIRSGKVKAGTVIAYSGNTGNTTGPHLHLEVRPHGGSPIDPLAWLLKHGLDPR